MKVEMAMGTEEDDSISKLSQRRNVHLLRIIRGHLAMGCALMIGGFPKIGDPNMVS